MQTSAIAAALLLCAVATGRPVDETVTVLRVDAIISLPYGHINEPVTVYMDTANNRSRTDYYNGQDIYLFDSTDNGNLRQVVPVDMGQSCFATAGTADSKIELQPIVPSDLHLYTSSPLPVIIRGIECTELVKFDVMDGRNNTYKFYTGLETKLPVFFSMTGYDYVFGSHYDVYTIDYTTFYNTTVPSSVFATPNNLTCGDFPGPGESISRGGLSLLERTSVKDEDDFVEHHFGKFVAKHGKTYEHEEERRRRKNTFRHNHRFIESHNRKHTTFTVALNHLADWDEEELRVLRGSFSTKKNHTKAAPTTNTAFEGATAIDWRNTGAVSFVKDQGICGSCWSFGSAEAFEGRFFIKNNYSVPLSQQALMDCSWQYGNNGCDGGEAFRAYEWVLAKKGLPSEGDYGLYEMADGVCHSEDTAKTAQLQSYQNISGDDTLLSALQEGPVAVAIDASQPTFTFYSQGVYYDENCKSGVDDLDHSVLAVGFTPGTGNTPNYWIVKNSWSTHWGQDGFIYMDAKAEACGVPTDATVPVVA